MSSYEDTHVHAVYEAIAPHFSATRHSPWPFVKQFLLAQPPSSVGLDIGCGNGKYLAVNPALHILGCDRSASLVALANQQHGKACQDNKHKDNKHKDNKNDQKRDGNKDKSEGGNKDNHAAALLTADSLALPFRPHSADFIICIAVIHHFSTPQRRRAAIEALLGCLRRGTGRALIYVWALEQGSSRRGWNEASEQDTLVPWVMKRKKEKKKTTTTTIKRDNNDDNDKGKSNSSSERQEVEPDKDKDKEEEEQTYQRYYHLYREGELEEDARHAGGEICESGYERDNWWVILKIREGEEAGKADGL
ncbi:hypothetical protein E4U21_002738 [Claviceps maximensis]|nr:hypothetical protein E4U21_002738 [Claviceps maximensis]